MRTGACWIAIAILCFALPLEGQFVQQGGKLVANDGSGSSAQGISVAVSADGNTAIVGGPEDNNGTGAVWFWIRVNSLWVRQGPKLVGTGATGVAAQGRAVALSADGNTAIVGGPNDNGGTGAVWIFVRNNGVWAQQGPKLWGSVLLGIAHQGISVALSADGTTALVGGDLYADRGAAWVFTRDTNSVWSLAPDLLAGSGTVGVSHQGSSVALSADGTTAIVGGPADNSGAGAVWTFTRGAAGQGWPQQGGKLTVTGATPDAGFGTSVALSADGTTAFVGASGDSGGAGSLWAFTRSGGQWIQQGKLVGSASAPSRLLGASVALSADGNFALAGGPGGLASGLVTSPALGAAWAFARSNGLWAQQGNTLQGSPPYINNDALQGTSVALSADGTTALVGGPADATATGAAWVFVRPPVPTPPVITAQPASQTVTAGQTAALGVTATGTPPLSYQWYQGARPSTSTPVGTNSSTYTTPVLTATTSYWVRVGNPYGSVDSNTAVLTVTVPGPFISTAANAASHSVGITPNTWVEIHGTNLAPAGDTRQWQTSDFVNNQMPVQLDGVGVTVNGKSAYVSYISPTQINILTPPDALQGPVMLQATSGGIAGPAVSFPGQSLSPSFFMIGGTSYIAAEHANFSYLGPASLYPGVTTPARPGEVVVLFGNGFGATTAPIVAGSPVQSGDLPTPPLVTIGGIAATVQFAGLVFPGEFQFNVVVPPGAPDGDQVITATYNGIPTQSGVLITVQH